jgi:hypothetical protein
MHSCMLGLAPAAVILIGGPVEQSHKTNLFGVAGPQRRDW